MNLHRVIIQASEGLCQAPRCGGLRVLIRLWKTYRLFPQVLWKTYKNCETLCVANCVVPETYVRGVLPFMRSCDSLHAKITRSQRLFRGHKHKAQRDSNTHKHKAQRAHNHKSSQRKLSHKPCFFSHLF